MASEMHIGSEISTAAMKANPVPAPDMNAQMIEATSEVKANTPSMPADGTNNSSIASASPTTNSRMAHNKKLIFLR